MRVTGQTPTSTTGRLGFQLQAEGEEEGEDTLEKRLTISQQAQYVPSSRKSTVIVRFSRVGMVAAPKVSPLYLQVS